MDIEYTAKRLIAMPLEQGKISFGNHPQSTILGSCMSIVMHSEKNNIGALCHIFGKKRNEFGLPNQVLDEYERLIDENKLFDAKFFVFGGSEAEYAIYVYNNTIDELEKRNIQYNIIDVLGRFSRKILYEPQLSKITINKETSSIYQQNN